jgi:hypothetical protein
MSTMNPADAVKRGGSSRDTELDERQRTVLYEASHKALRLVMLAVMLAMLVFNVLYDDIAISMTLAGIVFLGLFTHWWFLRRTGLNRELDEVVARETVRSSPLSLRNGFMFLVLFLAGTSTTLRDGRLTAAGAAAAAAIAIAGVLLLWTFERWNARRELRRAACPDGDD